MSVLQGMKRRAATVVGSRLGAGGIFWFHRAGTLLEHRLRLRERYARVGAPAEGALLNGLVDGVNGLNGASGKGSAHAAGGGPPAGHGGEVGAGGRVNGTARPGAQVEEKPARGGGGGDAGAASDVAAQCVGAMRVVTHATSGSVEDVRLPAPPPAPWRKRAARPERLAYFPRWHTEGHPRTWTFPNTLNEALPWVAQLKALYANPLSFPSTLSPEAGLLMHALVRNVRPRTVVETGAFVGVSTIWIAAALAENGDGGVVHTFDDFSPIKSMPWCDAEMPEGRLEFVGESLTRAGVAERVVAHQGHSAAALRGAAAELRDAGGVQLAFLDADHGVRGVWHDLWALEPALATGGFVILHDTFPEYCGHHGPRHLLDHVNRYAVGRYEKVDLYLSPINYGLGVLRRVG